MTVHTGSCLCTRIRYEIAGGLPDARVCHCSVCRKAFNGAGSYTTWIDSPSFAWTEGEDRLSTFENAEGFALGFCGTCGTTLCGLFNGQVVFVTLGSLDGAPEVRVGQHIFVGSKAPWDDIGGDAPQFETRPPEGDSTGR